MNLPYLVFLVFGLLLLALWWSSRQIGLRIQENVYLLTDSVDMAMVILFLIYLPGIFVHEGSHWITARLLGLKTGKFRVWPRKQGKHIGMGSVNVSRGDPIRDSLVGIAPLIIGSLLVAFIGDRIFATRALSEIWVQGDWSRGLVEIFDALLLQRDGLVWAYLIFAVANAMMPSASDREPLKALLLYLGLIVLLYFLLDSSGTLLRQIADGLIEPVQLLIGAFVFTLTLDIAILIFLYLLQTVLITLRTSFQR